MCKKKKIRILDENDSQQKLMDKNGKLLLKLK